LSSACAPGKLASSGSSNLERAVGATFRVRRRQKEKLAAFDEGAIVVRQRGTVRDRRQSIRERLRAEPRLQRALA
jgi:hypothetical protein